MSPSADKLIYLAWNPHRHTHTQHWHSLWLHYSVFPTHSLIPPNSLSPQHSIFLSLSLSSASPSASQVLILLSFHTIFQHRLPLLSLSSLALFTSAVKLSAATENVIIQCLLGSFPTNFNVWKLSLNFEWQWGRVSERERERAQGEGRGTGASCAYQLVYCGWQPVDCPHAPFSLPDSPSACSLLLLFLSLPPLLFLCTLCKLSPIHINHLASATQNTATY